MNRTVGVDESLSYVIICTVSKVEERPIPELPILSETLDVEALDALMVLGTAETPHLEGSIAFEYSDSHVIVWIDRSVTVSAVSTNKERLETGRT